MRYSLLLILTILNACSFHDQKTKVIVIQPFADFPKTEIETVFRGIKKINPQVIVRKSIPLPKMAYYKARNRYRADTLIRYLKGFAGEDTVVIGLLQQDISTTKGNTKDWGVMGLGYRPGNACIVSSYRLKKAKTAEQFYKVALHELGHCEGLPHCKVRTCFMRDAEGGNPLDEEREFCTDCRNHLKKEGWKI
jgi:archaemetzincin